MSELNTFKALLVEETANKQFTLNIVNRLVSDLPENDLLVNVHYSSLNYKDALSASGNKRVSAHFPHTPGIDAAGIVVRDNSGTFTPGDEVLVFGYDLGMNTPGGLGQMISIPAKWAIKRPENLSLKEAMSYGTGGLTAALCIQKLEKMGASPEDGPVAVTGSTGGVGSISIALLKQLGYSVVAFSGKPEQTEYLKSIGADEVLHRDVLNEAADLPMGKERWAHGIDTLGGDYLSNLLKQIKSGGGVSACGLAASDSFSSTVFPFIIRGVSLLGVDSVYIPLSDKQHIWHRVASDMKLPNLQNLCEEIPLEQTPEYLKRFIQAKVVGRYLVNLKN
ncbi:YhdH/YhfP family quinone oxidoreductase [Paraglaciecola psychrophila]|uniref:YhdH/YhfP family quinone oxidoreductase n=1 Tax=Paraglaciecola psychrophila 170 TaxID=1129794 RepID=K6ZM22_9ALTE|nr:YhdH/YhfP family quinone oxidoreductase [Paraglaciecola psychrophila]AGH43285.1 YhdH/YhfP family quinone oxidoreductase [Paraglaciecola psychrophila 170]GAC37011.1 zinc-binding alcohol dehydrogenase [Paraglaciecola psychrophila 170]